ncbi:alcohol dehydrogenase [Pseudoroseomonas wenyumeiae]|uniref:Alcohol dehydrogenase n=1 Tax=Teichococcus wenyumeiae TaxID=2478470 RepID=A0A3A9JPE3_9PROT|nr:zinc-dependent alcohol dehydrogenase family protein [Pseudoroseomonas wenyumeiae]RKK05746.1 alcohol dehydrogenase [Pseudoroseomonas wenyumeiae]RMI24960.1 alcohol dehydrogenase [Pseudoroseomonas wenyumeiae]
MKTRAAILRQSGLSRPYAQSQPLSIEEVELRPPGPEEVLVKIAAAGLCHSDLSGINGDRPRPLPVALGHEASGVVVETGSGVTDLAAGDHVVMSFLPVCGHCPSCSDGRASLCQPGHAANAAGTLLSGKRRIVCDGAEVNHHSGVSAFSEYSVIHRRSIVKIDQEIPLVQAALFGCAVMTGVGTVLNTCGVRLGQSVAVVGLGGVGLSSVLGAVAAGAGQVIAIDLSAEKLRIARDLGATHAFLADDPDIQESVRELTDGGVDHAVEMAGAAAAFELAFRLTRRGGTTATAGLASPNSVFHIPPVPLVAEERVIRGSYMGSCVPSRDIPRYISLFRSGKLPVDKLLSSTGPLEGINAAFDRLDRGEVVRHVVVMP